MESESYFSLMKKPIFFILVVATILLNSCGEMTEGVGNPQPETRSVAPFTEIISDNSVDITYRQVKDGVDKVVVTAQENLLPLIKTTVENGTLTIDTDGSYHTNHEMSIEIYARNLNSLYLNGSADFTSDGKINEQKFYLQINGSGDVDARLQCSSIEIDSNGSGDITLDGTTDYLEAELNGSGDLNALELRTFNTEFESNGSGDAKLFAKESLEIELNGSGDVSYKGRAKIDKTINGSGDVFEL